MQCGNHGKPGWKAGISSHCFLYRPGDDLDEARAKRKARLQETLAKSLRAKMQQR